MDKKNKNLEIYSNQAIMLENIHAQDEGVSS